VTVDRAKEQAKVLLADLLAYWPKTELPAPTMRKYLDCLVEHDAEDASLAVKWLGETRDYFPRVSELRRTLADIAAPAPERPDADQAWGQVVAQIRQVGWCGRPQLDPLVAETVDNVGGWLAVCEAPMDVIRKHFSDAYRVALGRANRERETAALPVVIRMALAARRAALEPTRLALPAPTTPQPATAPPPAEPGRIGKVIAALGGRTPARPARSGEADVTFEARRAAALAALKRWEARRVAREEAEEKPCGQ
jgi:hypothetical protein